MKLLWNCNKWSPRRAGDAISATVAQLELVVGPRTARMKCDFKGNVQNLNHRRRVPTTCRHFIHDHRRAMRLQS